MGMNRIKRLVRSKVWFPGIDAMVEDKVKRCMGCQAVERTGASPAPLQMSVLPRAPWVELSIDFFGPIAPTLEYILVLVDDYSRFVIAEVISTTSADVVIRKLEYIFSLFGNVEVVRSDNGPPFNSKQYEEYARRAGFKRRLVTPAWPMANGLDESIMKSMGKVVRTAKIDGVPWKSRLVEYLRQYRATPHSSTGVAPAALLFRNSDPSSLSSLRMYFRGSEVDKKAKKKDDERKQQMKAAGDKRLRVKPVCFKVGDLVLVKQQRTNKSMSHFEPVPYRIKAIKGTMITATSKGRSTTRNVSFFKEWRGESGEEEEAVLKAPKVQPPIMASNPWVGKIEAKLEDAEIDAEIEAEQRVKEDSKEDEVVTENGSQHDVTSSISSGEEKEEDGDEALLTADEERQEEQDQSQFSQDFEAEQVRFGAATGAVQAVVRAFEANDDGLPKSPEQAAAVRASRATRNQEAHYRDARAYTKK
jgi:transposase InsO family protein